MSRQLRKKTKTKLEILQAPITLPESSLAISVDRLISPRLTIMPWHWNNAPIPIEALHLFRRNLLHKKMSLFLFGFFTASLKRSALNEGDNLRKRWPRSDLLNVSTRPEKRKKKLWAWMSFAFQFVVASPERLGKPFFFSKSIRISGQ